MQTSNNGVWSSSTRSVCAFINRWQTTKMPKNRTRRLLKCLTCTIKRILIAVSWSPVSGPGVDTPISQPNKLFGLYCINGDVGRLRFSITGLFSARCHTSYFSKPPRGLQKLSQLANIQTTRNISNGWANSCQSSFRHFPETSATKRRNLRWRNWISKRRQC